VGFREQGSLQKKRPGKMNKGLKPPENALLQCNNAASSYINLLGPSIGGLG
jgi:hypothetical protein